MRFPIYYGGCWSGLGIVVENIACDVEVTIP